MAYSGRMGDVASRLHTSKHWPKERQSMSKAMRETGADGHRNYRLKLLRGHWITRSGPSSILAWHRDWHFPRTKKVPLAT